MNAISDITIGNHRLILADSLRVLPTLDGVDHVITDPPYEDSLHAAKNSAGRPMRTDGGAELSGLNFEGIGEMRAPIVEHCSKITRGWFLAFCTPEGVAPWANEINASTMKYKRACVWVKPDSTPQFNGQGPAAGVECFVAAWAGRGYSRWNGGGKRGVYTHLCNPPNRTGGHPTEKPINLMRELIQDFTQPDDVILDPFMGIGSTLVAAAQTGRRTIGIELNPEYYEIAVRRVRAADCVAQALGCQLAPKVQEVLL